MCFNRDITSETGKIGHKLLSNFEDGLASRIQIHLVGLRFVLEGRPDLSHRGDREVTHVGDGDNDRSIECRARGCS